VSVCLSVCSVDMLLCSRHGAVPYLLVPIFGVATLICILVLSKLLCIVVMTIYGNHDKVSVDKA